jgi:hypothetical protein
MKAHGSLPLTKGKRLKLKEAKGLTPIFREDVAAMLTKLRLWTAQRFEEFVGFV